MLSCCTRGQYTVCYRHPILKSYRARVNTRPSGNKPYANCLQQEGKQRTPGPTKILGHRVEVSSDHDRQMNRLLARLAMFTDDEPFPKTEADCRWLIAT